MRHRRASMTEATHQFPYRVRQLPRRHCSARRRQRLEFAGISSQAGGQALHRAKRQTCRDAAHQLLVVRRAIRTPPRSIPVECDEATWAKAACRNKRARMQRNRDERLSAALSRSKPPPEPLRTMTTGSRSPAFAPGGRNNRPTVCMPFVAGSPGTCKSRV